MGSLSPENPHKQELDDSGYVQEDAAPKEAAPSDMNRCFPVLLDLSDDVLLYILQYCSPTDLKALGFTCTRLSALVLDRTLWVVVDGRDVPTGRRRMKWLLTHALSPYTQVLRLSGYAHQAKGCLGYMTGSPDEPPLQAPPLCPMPDEQASWNVFDRNTAEDLPSPRLLRLSAQALPRYGGGFPYWPEQMTASMARAQPVAEQTGRTCPGPQMTLTHAAMTRLTQLCANLTELTLEYVVIDCNMTKITMFPRTLRILSLKGTKCFNLAKSFLYKIQDCLVYLEDLEVSYCEWIEPACMLPLSKLPRLTRLSMQHCIKLTEFVAYASLATRYGFKTLKILDLRGSPVGDSEVSALGWLPLLEQLYLSPASNVRHADHAHFSRVPPPSFTETLPWEDEEPDYYKSKYETEQWVQDENKPRRRVRHAKNCPLGAYTLLHHVSGEINQGRFGGDCAQWGCGPPCSCQTNPGRQQPAEGVPIEIGRDQYRAAVDQRIPIAMRTPKNMYSGANIDEGRPGYSGEQNAGNRTAEDRDKPSGSKRKIETEDSGTMKRNKDEGKNSGGGPGSSLKRPSSSKSDGNNSSSDDSDCEMCTCKEKTISSNVASTSKMGVTASNAENSSTSKAGSSSKRPRSTRSEGSYSSSDDSDCETCNISSNVASTSKMGVTASNAENSWTSKAGSYSKRPRSTKSEGNYSSSGDSDCEMCNTSSNVASTSKMGVTASNAENSSKPNTHSLQSDAFLMKARMDKSQPKKDPSGSEDSSDGEALINLLNKTLTKDIPTKASRKYYEDNHQPSPSKPKESLSDFKKRLLSGKERRDIGDNGNDASNNENNNEGDDGSPKQKRYRLIEIHAQVIKPPQDLLLGPTNTASTSKEDGGATPSTGPSNQPSTSRDNGNQEPQRFVRFRLNQLPVVIDASSQTTEGFPENARDDNHNVHNNNDVQQPDWNNLVAECSSSGGPSNPNPGTTAGNAHPNSPSVSCGTAVIITDAEDNQEEPEDAHQRILYLNVGRYQHAMYQISMPEPVDLRTQRPLTAAMNLLYSSHSAPRLEYTSLVTDAAIRRFGRADGENINYVQIGPMGLVPAPYDEPHARPNRSNLRILSVTGFRHITNYSLTHLATSAPFLQSIDFTGTRVTESGVEHFRNVRPDCRVRYGPIDTPKDDSGRPHSR